MHACKTCSKTFKRRDNLDRHREEVHRKMKRVYGDSRYSQSEGDNVEDATLSNSDTDTQSREDSRYSQSDEDNVEDATLSNISSDTDTQSQEDHCSHLRSKIKRKNKKIRMLKRTMKNWRRCLKKFMVKVNRGIDESYKNGYIAAIEEDRADGELVDNGGIESSGKSIDGDTQSWEEYTSESEEDTTDGESNESGTAAMSDASDSGSSN